MPGKVCSSNSGILLRSKETLKQLNLDLIRVPAVGEEGKKGNGTITANGHQIDR